MELYQLPPLEYICVFIREENDVIRKTSGASLQKHEIEAFQLDQLATLVTVAAIFLGAAICLTISNQHKGQMAQLNNVIINF